MPSSFGPVLIYIDKSQDGTIAIPVSRIQFVRREGKRYTVQLITCAYSATADSSEEAEKLVQHAACLMRNPTLIGPTLTFSIDLRKGAVVAALAALLYAFFFYRF